MNSGPSGVTVFLLVASGILPLLVWTVVLGIGAVVLRRCKPAGALVMLAAGLALGVQLINLMVTFGVTVAADAGVSMGGLEMFFIGKQLGTVLLNTLVHVLLLVAAFAWRSPAEPEN